MSKVLSIIVPCYNSEAYLVQCIDSLLLGQEAVEIIIVNDGSVDCTAMIADAYAKKYPSIVKVIHQKNGGHGQAINAGLSEATGTYLKVVDSDDWLGEQAYAEILTFLTAHQISDQQLDMVICNYVYEKQGTVKKKVMEYRSFLPMNRIFSWPEVKFPLGKYLLMHSVIYRTALLQELALPLPAHTFYVDNLYVFQPLPLVEKMYYLDLNLYHYFIGREDQSVNEAIMISRIDQQIFVNKQLISYFSNDIDIEARLKIYMSNFIEIVTTVSTILLIKDGSAESLAKKDELWAFIKATNPMLYRKLRRRALGVTLHLPGVAGKKIALGVYRISQKVYGFN